MTHDALSQVMKASNVLGTPEIAVEGGPHPNDVIRLMALDVNNDSTDTFQVNLKESSDVPFRFVFKSENFKMTPGDYDVEISYGENSIQTSFTISDENGYRVEISVWPESSAYNDGFDITLSDSGNYPYFCMVHPWMEGTVIVE